MNLKILNEIHESIKHDHYQKWPWPVQSNEQIKSLLSEMQTMNQRLQNRIDELNLRLIHLEEIVRDWNVNFEE